ncbi:MAG: DUF4304 domain-containing protein [Lachnospiraceae bacterium]|nr:DUF4304 domain-containing protein [Lachnospiraceae bacterium]
MGGNFKLKGNVQGAIRSDNDMKLIDKKAADEAFKCNKKRIDIYLKDKGFIKYKTNSFVRINSLDVLEYIDLQKERYGSKTFTVNYALIALYVPHDFLSFDLSDRLGHLICGKDVWWDYSEDSIAYISFQNVIDAFDEYLMPYFEKLSSKEAIKQELLKEKSKREQYGGRLSNDQQAWLNVIDDDLYNNEIIKKNIEVFKLPSRTVR